MPKVKKSSYTVSEVNLRRRDQLPWRWMAIAAVVIGVALRIWQYAANPSIWVDEAAIARNVLDRHPLELFGSLDYGQIAAPGFLLGVKLSVALLGFSEYALRLVPFIAGIVSPALFYIVARSVLRPVGTIVATLMFSMAIPLVFFSSNLKQYSLDVAVTLLVIGIALRLRRSPLALCSACGFAFISVPLLFCSQAAVFPLTVAGVVVFTDAFVVRRLDRWYRFVVVASWAAAVVATVAYSSWVMTTVDNVYLHRFWEQAFMPREGAIRWLWMTAKNVFEGPPRPDVFDGSLHYALPGFFAALVAVGSVAMCAKTPAIGALMVGPIVLTLVASAAHAYPFGTRVSLFLLPLLLMSVVAGVDYVAQVLIPRRVGEYAPVLLLLFAIATLLQQLPPHRPEHLRPVMQYVSDHWKAGDALWVYYGAGQAFEYYRKLIPVHGDIRVGDCNRTDPREYLRQVDVERGRARVWVLMAHGSAAFRFDERKMLIAYLDTIGRRVDEFHAPPEDSTPYRAAVFLFDLSDPGKLAHSSAELFAIQNNYPPMTWTCYGTMSPHGPNSRVVAAVMGVNAP
jgi:hypothetical protein